MLRISLLCVIIFLPAYSQYLDDPTLSLRCRKMLQNREDKKKSRQKISFLLEKSNILIGKTPSNKKVLLAKLNRNRMTLGRELSEKNKQIVYLEEDIIRKGCPGIRL